MSQGYEISLRAVGPDARILIVGLGYIRIFERGECSFRDLFKEITTTFESNVQFTLRFMIDTKLVGMNWIEVPAGSYKLTPESKKRSHCQIELSVRSVLSAYGCCQY